MGKGISLVRSKIDLEGLDSMWTGTGSFILVRKAIGTEEIGYMREYTKIIKVYSKLEKKRKDIESAMSSDELSKDEESKLENDLMEITESGLDIKEKIYKSDIKLIKNHIVDFSIVNKQGEKQVETIDDLLASLDSDFIEILKEHIGVSTKK